VVLGLPVVGVLLDTKLVEFVHEQSHGASESIYLLLQTSELLRQDTASFLEGTHAILVEGGVVHQGPLVLGVVYGLQLLLDLLQLPFILNFVNRVDPSVLRLLVRLLLNLHRLVLPHGAVVG